MRRDPKKKLIYPPPDTYLRACKPTEGQAWVHVLCSAFIPEITFSDAARLKLVEGISAIPARRWQNVSLVYRFGFVALVLVADLRVGRFGSAELRVV